MKSLREVRWPKRSWSEVRLALTYLDVSGLPASNRSTRRDKYGWMGMPWTSLMMATALPPGDPNKFGESVTEATTGGSEISKGFEIQ